MHTYEELFNLFDKYRRDNAFHQDPKGLYEPANYIMDLGGKRLRPVMLLLSCDMLDGKVEDALPAAYAMELFHNFTLVHDDIMDAAPLRRGKPTVHQKYNTNQAILTGDVMMVKVYEWLQQLPAVHFYDVVKVFNEAAVKVCEGQQYDMDFEVREDVTMDEYLRMINYKTAALLACCLRIGAMLGRGDEPAQSQMAAFGTHLGIAFQLQDDWLDAFGDGERFGKQTGGDILQGKKTFLRLKAMELANQEEAAFLKEYVGSDRLGKEEKVTRVKAIYAKLDLESLTKKAIDEHYQTAVDNLNAINVGEERKTVLRKLAEKIKEREF